jgi:hypothetical protein
LGATQTATWKTTGGGGFRATYQGVSSGYISSTYGTQYGYWFYGTGVSDTCKGYTPDSGTIVMVRNGNNGYSGYNYISQHSLTSAGDTTNGASPPNGLYIADNGPNMSGTDAVATYSLPSNFLANFGSGAAKGMMTLDSSSYRDLRGIDTNGYSGALTLVFN